MPSAISHGRVALVAAPNGVNTGIGRYVEMLRAGLKQGGVEITRVAPSLPPVPDSVCRVFRWFGRDLRAFMTNYPLWWTYPEADIYHLAAQNLASLLLLRRPTGKVIVTVHDVFPYMVRNDPQLGSPYGSEHLYYRLPIAGLKRADHLIAVSQSTRQCLVDHLRIAPERISVVYNGIDHTRFRSVPVPTWVYEKYRLVRARRYLIYVGSEDPRKNLATLVGALARVRIELPDVELIKVGRSHFERERERLIKLANQLGVRATIHFVEDVSENELPLLYNLADVCVMPSLYEGFGFPVLEAMACGTPVVHAGAGSLPEIAGRAAIPVFPCDVDGLAGAITGFLKAGNSHSMLRTTGQEQASKFTWAATIKKTAAVYQRVLNAKAKLIHAVVTD